MVGNGEKRWETMRNGERRQETMRKNGEKQWETVRKNGEKERWEKSGLVMRTWYILAPMLKIYIYIGINAHVTFVDGMTESEDRAILKQNSQFYCSTGLTAAIWTNRYEKYKSIELGNRINYSHTALETFPCSASQFCPVHAPPFWWVLVSDVITHTAVARSTTVHGWPAQGCT